MTTFEQDQAEDDFDGASRFRYHVIVYDLANDEAHVLDTKTGKTLTSGTVRECQEYMQQDAA